MKNSYEKSLNEILQSDVLLKAMDEKIETIKGHLVTVWEKISEHRYRRVETYRKGANV
jgi:hypothetical protein